MAKDTATSLEKKPYRIRIFLSINQIKRRSEDFSYFL